MLPLPAHDSITARSEVCGRQSDASDARVPGQRTSDQMASGSVNPLSSRRPAGSTRSWPIDSAIDHGVDRDAAAVEPREQFASPVGVRAVRIEEPNVDPPLLVRMSGHDRGP
jgi:hypothetical protein